jgi:hypothetical protein
MELFWAFAKVEMKGDSELASKYQLFIHLVETCKEWNRIVGFKPDWKINNYYCVSDVPCHGLGVYLLTGPRVLHFRDERTAELFLKTFRDEIELVKDLI